MMSKKELLEISGELTKNIGLGIFVNGVYGVSDGTIEIFNIIDVVLGVSLMIIGIIAERKAK
jgi:hypothetical protein